MSQYEGWKRGKDEFSKKDVSLGDPFTDIFPSDTKGDGKISDNNAHTGGAQGRASSQLKAKCVQCGFPNDLTRIDHSGGDLTGNGATTATAAVSTSTNSQGTTYTEKYAAPGIRAGGGCANCGSKNSTSIRTISIPPDFPDQSVMGA